MTTGVSRGAEPIRNALSTDMHVLALYGDDLPRLFLDDHSGFFARRVPIFCLRAACNAGRPVQRREGVERRAVRHRKHPHTTHIRIRLIDMPAWPC